MIGYWVIGTGCWIEKDLERSSIQSLKFVRRFLKIIALVYNYQLVKFDDSELWFKRYIQKSFLSHVLILIVRSQIW